MSAIVGVCAVLSWFLIQQLVFHTKVANETDKTVGTLKENVQTVEKLRENVRLLEVNPDLGSVKADPDEKALQVILDALPADNNTLALGASLQQKLIGTVDNVKIESLTVGQDDGTQVPEAPLPEVQVIPFTLVVSSPDVNALKDVMAKFERSIRTIGVGGLVLDRSDAAYKLSMTGYAYYKPPVQVELKDKEVKP